MKLAAYQDAFAAALLADDPVAGTPPDVAALTRQPGFAVYRNTVLKGCIDALQANYPTVARLVGEEWFRAAAAVFARGHLPTQPALLHYGERFPAFLAAFAPAQAIPYLAAVAQVDRWWMEAHAAADAPALDAARLAALRPAALSMYALVLHPATRWGWNDDWPIHTLWTGNRDDSGAGSVDAPPIDWVGQGVLVARPLGPVGVAQLSRGGVALLDACAAGRSVAEAVAMALDAEADLDVAALIHQCLRAGAFSALQAIARKEEDERVAP